MARNNKNYISGRFYFKTDIGRIRLTNEDQAQALTNAAGNILLFVCDGMGGQSKGDFASSLAKKVITESFKEKHKFWNKFSAYLWMKKTIREANNKIYNESLQHESYEGMGTTLTIVLLVHDYMLVGQIGDSRLYLNSQHGFSQISDDQTYVAYLYRTGQISKEEMRTHPRRHVLMNALGNYPAVNVDCKFLKYQNETLLLCSDGLYNNVSDTDIESIIKGNDSTEQKVNELISLANANGGSDNIAIVLWEGNK